MGLDDYPIGFSSLGSKKSERDEKDKSMLSKAINEDNRDYIIQFLLMSGQKDAISNLSKNEIKMLVEILLDLLDTPYRTSAIEYIYEILLNSGNLEVVSKKLINVSLDLNKLAYLKGKIDYLKRRSTRNKTKEQNQ